jgi:hypothetical protein
MCAHVWPAELEPEAPCEGCGLPYGEWSEYEQKETDQP